MRIIFVIAAFLMGSSAVLAQEEAAAGPCDGELFRQFDFWVGDWDVFDTDGNQLGTNSITLEESGCLMVENWTDIQGNTGQSYNFVDHGTGKWRQVWVSPGVVIDYDGGLDENGAIDLQGTISVVNSEPQQFRGTWTLQEDGTVLQHLRSFDAAKDEWVGGKGIYKKRSEAEE